VSVNGSKYLTRTALRLVTVTGYGQAEDRRRAAAAGFDAHLVKPIDLEDLRKVLFHIRDSAEPRHPQKTSHPLHM
jgi:CheY-like chemotaxis protein